MTISWSVGSTWLRVDPHIHAPGTLRENGYGDHSVGATWAAYVERLRTALPSVSALGITDYFLPRGYRLFKERVTTADLPELRLVFPNIELRLNIKTDRGHAVNVHLLVSPDDPDHLSIIESKLHALTFRYGAEAFACSEDDLRRLGRAHARKAHLDNEAALREGAGQFLVDFGDLAKLKNDAWIAKNVLFTIAAGNDGLSGLSKDSGFHAQREELAALSDIVFSGSPSDRRFWLGEHADFNMRGYVKKPCLHGCDAHTLDKVLVPNEGRLCWIRSEATFDGLRQTLVEPERRVFIGGTPPAGPAQSNVIRHVRILDADWALTSGLELNDGLVTVIGSRGSGKTALVELIALAADASDPEPGPASFIGKARELLAGAAVEIEWGDGTTQTRGLLGDDGVAREPRVRYLSQQFVERLSSPTGLADELLDEIERVVFDAIPMEDRLLCSTFGELRDGSLQDAMAQRDADREVIRSRTTAIAEEHRLSRAIPSLKAKVQEAERDRAAIDKELTAIPVQANNELVKAHRDATERLTKLQEAIAAESLRARGLVEVASEFRRHARAADDAHTSLKATYADLLDATAWERLRVRPDETALTMLADLKTKADDRVSRLRHQGVNAADGNTSAGPGPEGIVALTAACEKATKALGEDLAQAKRRSELEKKLSIAKQAEEQHKKRLTNAEGSPKRQKASSSERYEAYERIFVTLGDEAESLDRLYQPLRTRLEADERLRNLSFFVRRRVALDEWVERGEALLDLRKPPFLGAGALAAAARSTLLRAWEKGTASEARAALEKFASDHGAALSALRREATPLDFGEWLFSTDHISVQYGIRYEGVDLGSLSPGARGVVLLTLYLALDDVDTRPLVIDQPEENLDPKSIYAYLVPFFRDAARRRQIIMVTHNANLVVNSDSDQVIVAEAERKSPIELPRIHYSAGGLEDSRIRGLVCQYLEGGVEAFRRRGQRYGVGTSG